MEEWVDYDGGVVQNWHRSARRIRVAPHVTAIPEWAFRGCNNLRVADLGNVVTISDYAFWECISLERVVRNNTASAVEIGEWAFYGCKKLMEIDLSHATKIGADAFFQCVALERVSIPSSVALIEARAFAGCTTLTNVGLGEGIPRIGDSAFYYCNSLVRISIPASVTDIEYRAFDGCSRLVEVKLNEGLQNIGDRAFQHCQSLQSISIPSTALEIGFKAFLYCRQLRDAALQEGLQTIGEGAFQGCHSLERITIPSSTMLVGKKAFWACRNLSEVTMHEGIVRIDDEAFGDCSALEYINIPPVAFVIDIDNSRCQLLRTATLPRPLVRMLVVSKWMQYRSPDQLEQAEAKVNEILGRNDLTAEVKIGCVREWFAYCDMVDVTTLLELAIWSSNMDGNEQDAEVRQARRRNCGNDVHVIIPCVMPFLLER